MKKIFTLFIIIFLKTAISLTAQEISIETNVVCEWTYQSEKQYADPFNEVSLKAEIEIQRGKVISIPAFWAGGNSWKFRFSFPKAGEFSFITICSDTKNKKLHKRKGKIKVEKYKGNNPLYQHGAIQVSTKNQYLVHEDGKPFFWLADSWWHGMTKRFSFPEDFKTLTKDRKEKGFTTIQFAVGFPCDIAPFDPRGQNEAGDPWDKEWKSIRPEYFDLTDKRINHLLEQGMMPNIVGAWGYYIKWAGVEKMKKHWEYLIARYGAYPITWTLAGEVTLAWYDDLKTRWPEEKEKFRAQWSEVAEFIQQNDPYNRLLTVHPGPNSGDLKPINKMEYIDMFMCQSGHDGYFTLEKSVNSILEAQKLYPDKPVIHGEVCFEGMDGKSLQDVQRFLFWSNMLMGTPGFSYGVEGIWQFNTEEELFGVSPTGHIWGNVPWEKAYKYEGSLQIGLGKKFLDNYEWWKLTPKPERIETKVKERVSIPFCAQIEDKELFIYTFRKPSPWRSFSILNFDSDKSYNVIWFDPITGDQIEETILSDGEGKIHIDHAPIMQDWVLLIHLN